MSQSLYKSGKYSYEVSNDIQIQQWVCIVAIPYKSGKYSYTLKDSHYHSIKPVVAIPYKSGKYSYKGLNDLYCLNLVDESRNPL